MNKLLISILFCCFCCSAFAQTPNLEIPLNSSTVFKDINGNQISFERFIQWTSGTGYKISPSFDEAGNLLEVFVLEAAVAPARPRSVAVKSTAPHFSVSDIHGEQFDLAALKGKVVVLKFWFAACQPCVKEMPQLNQVFENYRHNPDVVFLAPSLDKLGSIQSFLNRQAFHYKIIPKSTQLADTYNVFSYPTQFVINRDGKIQATFTGMNSKIGDKLTRAIEEALHPTSVVASEVVGYVPPPPMPEEVVISPASVIKNEAGELVSFETFVSLMRNSRYELENQQDSSGITYVLMKEVKGK